MILPVLLNNTLSSPTNQAISTTGDITLPSSWIQVVTVLWPQLMCPSFTASSFLHNLLLHILSSNPLLIISYFIYKNAATLKHLNKLSLNDTKSCQSAAWRSSIQTFRDYLHHQKLMWGVMWPHTVLITNSMFLDPSIYPRVDSQANTGHTQVISHHSPRCLTWELWNASITYHSLWCFNNGGPLKNIKWQ
jgi:hypothetical protein